MNDRVDEQLRKWAVDHEPPTEALDTLASRIRNEIVRDRVHGAGHAHHAHWHHALYALAGAAAACVLTCLWFTSDQHGNGRAVHSSSADATAAIPHERLEAVAGLVGEMNKLFEDKWRWVSESNGDMHMGVAGLHGGVSSTTQPMILRLSLASRDDDTRPWQKIWHSDIVLHSEEAVEIATNGAGTNRVAFWILPLANGTLHVDTDISLTQPLRLTSRESMVVQDGTPTELMSFTEGTKQYKLYQTIKLIGEDDEGSA